jgi:hypothetical protein
LQDFGILLSFIADCTRDADADARSRAFGLLTAVFAVAFSFAPLINLVLSADTVFLVAAAVAGANCVFVLVCVPESYFPEEALHQSLIGREEGSTSTDGAGGHVTDSAKAVSDSNASIAHIHGVSSTPLLIANDLDAHTPASSTLASSSSLPVSTVDKSLCKPFAAMRVLWQTKYLTTLALITFFEGVSENGLIDTALNYLQKKLDFHRRDNVILLSGDGVAVCLSQFLLYPFLLRFMSLRAVLAFSLFFNAMHCFLYATIWTYDAIYPIMVATGIGRIGTAAMAALTSQHVNAAMQGQTQVQYACQFSTWVG